MRVWPALFLLFALAPRIAAAESAATGAVAAAEVSDAAVPETGIVYVPMPGQTGVALAADERELLTTFGADNPSSPVRTPLHLHRGVHYLRFQFGCAVFGPQYPRRLRFKIDGFDQDWRDTDQMRCVILFCDRSGAAVGSSFWRVEGESPGWRGNVANSTFVRRREEVIVPAYTTTVRIMFLSSGNTSAVGWYAVDAMTVQIVPPDGRPGRVVKFDAEAGQDLDGALGVPTGWQRSGSKPQMARVMRLDRPAPHHVLVLADDDPKNFAIWVAQSPQLDEAQPGDRLILQWREAYNIGNGGTQSWTERVRLPPGNYSLRVAAATLDGELTGREISLPLLVLPPFWQQTWFMVAAGLLAAGLALGIWRYMLWLHMQRELMRIRQQQALAEERTRIARDIHDDLGANLAEIAMISELARQNLPANDPAQIQFNEIFTRAESNIRRLGEIVWAINPANDTLEHFAGYLCKFVQDYLALAGIRCRLDLPETLPPVPLSSIQRHNLFLAAKEAVHNAVKHGAPGELTLHLATHGQEMVITIADNGRGFGETAAGASPRGNANMRARMERIGGKVDRHSIPGQGTTVVLTAPFIIPARSL